MNNTVLQVQSFDINLFNIATVCVRKIVENEVVENSLWNFE